MYVVDITLGYLEAGLLMDAFIFSSKSVFWIESNRRAVTNYYSTGRNYDIITRKIELCGYIAIKFQEV